MTADLVCVSFDTPCSPTKKASFVVTPITSGAMLVMGGEAMTLQEYRPVYANVLFTCNLAGSKNVESLVMMATIAASECPSALGRESWHTTFNQSISPCMFSVFGTHQGNRQKMTGKSSDTKHDMFCMYCTHWSIHEPALAGQKETPCINHRHKA